jgi:hypothetical protein
MQAAVDKPLCAINRVNPKANLFSLELPRKFGLLR